MDGMGWANARIASKKRATHCVAHEWLALFARIVENKTSHIPFRRAWVNRVFTHANLTTKITCEKGAKNEYKRPCYGINDG